MGFGELKQVQFKRRQQGEAGQDFPAMALAAEADQQTKQLSFTLISRWKSSLIAITVAQTAEWSFML
jgi:hypothetical protein